MASPRPRSHVRRATSVALALTALSAPHARAQDAVTGSVAGSYGGAVGDELTLEALVTSPYLTTADNANPGGLTLWSGIGTAPSSGSPTSFNDPSLGFNSTRYWAKGAQYSGVTRLVMTYQTRNTTTNALGTAAFLCSGAVVNHGYSVLTAAHCLHNYTASGTQYTLQNVQVQLGQSFGGNTTAEPGAGAPSVNQSFNYTQTVLANRAAVHPQYTGAVIDAHDIALLNLKTPVPSQYRSYGLYAGSGVGQTYNIVGWGGRGNGNNGTVAVGTPASTGAGARIRQGLNTFDITYADARWNPAFLAWAGLGTGVDVYLSDFDNGTSTNNALCRLTNATFNDGTGSKPIWIGSTSTALRPCGTGLGLDEVSSAGGDSGGPSFIGGQIAAVTSFGQTWGLGDFKSGLNSSFGELNGMTRVDINATWVQASVTTPEPATLALVGGGLLGLAGLARRRRAA